ncbi:MAG: hypothetical protein MJE68_24985, partial [Proteobacteria bacterium]|nr:hypothetical protein [Pseudomonadota bacterium]
MVENILKMLEGVNNWIDVKIWLGRFTSALRNGSKCARPFPSFWGWGLGTRLFYRILETAAGESTKPYFYIYPVIHSLQHLQNV